MLPPPDDDIRVHTQRSDSDVESVHPSEGGGSIQYVAPCL